MKEPDVSSWSREELEAAYKQSQKNVAARGQSLAHAQKKIAELEKQLEGWQPDEVEQTIAEQAERIEALGKELDDERATRKRAVQYAEELENEIKAVRTAAEMAMTPEVRYVNNPETVIRVEGPRPQMMTVYFSGEEGEG